jgi:hypothetical protein
VFMHPVEMSGSFWFCRKLDVGEAVEKLTRMMEWRRDFMPTPLTEADVAAEAATGKAFLHSHTDVNGRPVIVVRAARHITGAETPQSIFVTFSLGKVVLGGKG